MDNGKLVHTEGAEITCLPNIDAGVDKANKFWSPNAQAMLAGK